MNTPSNNAVGYGRVPEHTKWKTGQTGNPRRVRRRTTKPAVELIDEFFASQKVVVENGIRQRRTAFEIILLQLFNKAIAGNTRALNVLAQYRQFAGTRPGASQFVALLVDNNGNPIEPGGKDG
jgi:hypothetical protein